jgi:DNA-binding GntR family transcriptional regulator
MSAIDVVRLTEMQSERSRNDIECRFGRAMQYPKSGEGDISANGLARPTTRTLRAWVLNQLTARIIDGTMPPGFRLVESTLSAELGVSRSPLREALRQLEKDGLVTTLPNTSTIVAPVRPSDIDEIYEIRIGLEPLMAGYAALNRSDSIIQLCYQLNEKMRDFTTGVDFANDDFSLHDQLWLLASRPRISAILESLSRQALRQLALAANGLSDASVMESFKEHQRLLDAIEAGDSSAAASLMREHLLAGRNRMLEVMLRDQS